MPFCTVISQCSIQLSWSYDPVQGHLKVTKPEQPIESFQEELPYGPIIWSHDHHVYKLDHRDFILTHTLTPN